MIFFQAEQCKTKQLDEDGLLELIRTLPGKKSKYQEQAEQAARKVNGLDGKTDMQAHTCTVFTHVHARTHTHTYTHTQRYTQIHIHRHTHAHKYTHTSHIDTHTHTHTHTSSETEEMCFTIV